MWLKEYYEVLGAATKKAQAYTDQEVSKVRTKFAVVASYADLPNPGRTDTIYLVPKAGFVSVYDQYIYENDQYTDIGDTELDLDSYATDLELSQGLATKVDKVEGKGLSTEDYTTEEKTKLESVEAGAEPNVQADFAQTDTTADDFIKNKPVVDSALDLVSENAIQNKAVTEKTTELEAAVYNTDQTVSGNPITIETGSIGIAKSTELTMSPIQDLHGYDKPWAAGQGNNILDINEFVPGAGVTKTVSGNKITVTADGTSGTYQNVSYGYSTKPFEPGTYYIKAKVVSCQNTSLYSRFGFRGDNNSFKSPVIDLSSIGDKSITITLTESCYVSICVNGTESDKANTVVMENIIISKTDVPFEPYSNVCPISGRTQAEIVGCGKNMLNLTVDGIKTANTTGTWSGNIYTIDGNTFEILTDASNNVVGIKVNGTFSSTVGFNLTSNANLPKGNYIINGCPSGLTNSSFLAFYNKDTSQYVDNRDYGSGGSVSLGDANYSVRIRNGNNAVLTNAIFKPMVRPSTETDATYEPYVQYDVTISLGQTVYGGTLNVETGVLTITHARVDLGSLSWSYNSGEGHQRFDSTGIQSLAELPATANDLGDIICEQYQTATNSENFSHSKPSSIALGQVGNGHLFVWDSRYTDSTAFTTAVTGVYACYKLATPTTTTLTPAQVTLLKGINNISTDADSIKMTYTINDFVTETEMNTALESKANVIDLNDKADLTSFGPLEVITASTNYAEGDYMIFEGKFCKASSAITAGDTLEIGTNLTETTIAAELLAIISQLPTT